MFFPYYIHFLYKIYFQQITKIITLKYENLNKDKNIK